MLADGLHPGPNQRNKLTKPEQTKIAMAQCDKSTQEAMFLPLFWNERRLLDYMLLNMC